MVPGQVLGGMTASLGSVLLGAVDSSGVSWSLMTLDGWDSPEVRSTLTDREGDHGSWYAPVYLGSRPVTLTGVISAPDSGTLDAAIEQLLAAITYTDTVLTVGETIPKQAVVRRSGKPLVTKITGLVASYSILVTAADPRRYDVNQQAQTTGLPVVTGGLVLPATVPWTLSATAVTGDIPAVNAGSMETRPVFAVAGPVTQPQVGARYPDGTTRILSYSQNLLAGEVLTIDTDSGSVTVGGASRRRWISGDWPDIPASSQVTFTFRSATGAYDPAALMTATWRSAWI